MRTKLMQATNTFTSGFKDSDALCFIIIMNKYYYEQLTVENG